MHRLPLMFFKRNVALLGYMFVPLKFRARMTWFLETVLLPRAASTCKLDALVT